jgi:serine/threonine-protein phosphatase CPPED1
MQKLIAFGVAAAVLAGAVVFSQTGAKTDVASDASSGLKIVSEDRNPWTHLRLNNDSGEFQFAVVSDRTGGHREKIFSKAVEQLNLLQPEFVLSVGDLIEGYSKDKEKIAREWKEFQGFTSKLQMPFFYVPGNHDITNDSQLQYWQEKFGRSYYHFVYKDVLFLMLNSEDPPGKSGMSEAQVKYVKETLAANDKVRWTIVSFHKPVWLGNIETNGWGEIEKTLNCRNYTVFIGHVHKYVKYVRNGMNYYQLATTGGDSKLRGIRYGEFDHLVWVTMKKTGPVLANVLLDGILPENLQIPETDEPVVTKDRKPSQPTKGIVYFDGVPAAGATVSFHSKSISAKEVVTYKMIGDALVEGDGSFAVSSHAAFDGLPVGEYQVTVSFDGRFVPAGDKKGTIPEAYTKPATTPLTVTVKSGTNEFSFDVKKPAGKE